MAILLRFFLASAFSLTVAIAAADEIHVGVGNAEGANGQEVAIPITVKGAENFAAIQMRLSYDPAVLEPKEDAEAKDEVKHGQVNKAPLAKHANTVAVIGEGGVGLSMATTELVQGDGAIFMPVFVVRGQAGQKSPLKLESVRAWEGKNGQELAVTTEPGEFQVGQAGLPWTYLWIGLGALLVLLLIIVAAVRLRRNQPVIR